MPAKDEINRLDLAMLYELRLIISEDERETYSKDELFALLDQIAIAKK